MKDNLFEILLNLFETTLTKLKENSFASSDKAIGKTEEASSSFFAPKTLRTEFLQSANATSMRVFTPEEQAKFTKASYQFLMKMLTWRVIHSDTLEMIINKLLFSSSHIVTLDETKWVIRDSLTELLDDKQLAFLDLVLYQKEDGHLMN